MADKSLHDSLAEQHAPMVDLAAKVAELLLNNKVRLATAESCTGGGVAQILTDIAGSSVWFECGWVTYSNQSKTNLLGVDAHSITSAGAVSQLVVEQMARGAVRCSGANIGVSVSGVAGPGGGSADKPVGTVWIAWADEQNVSSQLFHFNGDRHSVRISAIKAALSGLIDLLSSGLAST